MKDWDKLPAVRMGIREFHGGDLQGVLDKLDYLQRASVWRSSISTRFPHRHASHKYDIQDYDYIDPHIGKIVRDEGELLTDWADGRTVMHPGTSTRVTDKANLEASESSSLLRLVGRGCTGRGMRVILDGVFNHCGSFNKWMDRERIYENAGRL